MLTRRRFLLAGAAAVGALTLPATDGLSGEADTVAAVFANPPPKGAVIRGGIHFLNAPLTIRHEFEAVGATFVVPDDAEALMVVEQRGAFTVRLTECQLMTAHCYRTGRVARGGRTVGIIVRD